MKQKTFIFILVLLSTLTASAYDAQIDGIYYNLDNSTKQATVTSGENKHTGWVIIPEAIAIDDVIYNVTTIGEYAFYGCSGLTSMTIPNSVTSIGNGAFSGCSGLTSIEIPTSVTIIGPHVFDGCSGLTTFTVPNSVTTIETSAFAGCTGLTSVIIGNSVKKIGSEAFSSCSNLTSLTIGNSVTEIGSSAFSGCSSLTSVELPSSVTSIGGFAFISCSGLTSIEIPNSVTEIGNGAFHGCSGLTSITIPNSVTSLGYMAFSGCSGLTSATIPNSVAEIGWSTFARCSSLTDVYCYAASVPTTDSNAFSESPISSATLHVPAASLDAYKAAEPWSGFGSFVAMEDIPLPINYVLNYNYDISAKTATVVSGGSGYTGKITIPATVTSNDIIYNVTEIGEDAFLSCTGITSVEIPNSVTVIGNSAFDGCSGLTSIEIPNSVTTIGSGAFASCTGLTSVTIPSSVTAIETVTFYNCTGLKEVIIPNSVTEIGFWAFASCTGLKNVYCYAENVPKTDINAFMSTSISTDTLRVPKAFVEAYQAASPWNGFGTFIALDIEPEVKKCATPTIDFVDGKIVFGCETEDVEYVCNIGFKNDGNILSLPKVVTISVYATKDGYEPSESLAIETTPKVLLDKLGDVNGDGVVNGTDIQEVINIIVNAE